MSERRNIPRIESDVPYWPLHITDEDVAELAKKDRAKVRRVEEGNTDL